MSNAVCQRQSDTRRGLRTARLAGRDSGMHPASGAYGMNPADNIGQADYRRFFELSLDLLCVAGLDGYFKLVSPAWTRVTGWSAEELLARPVADFMHPDDRERTLRARAELARGVLVQGLENRYVCKDGSYRWFAWQSSVDLAQQRVYAVARDITERRRRDQEKLVSSKLESTGILAGGIAHDFNNLLAKLLLNLDMCGMSGPMTDAQQSYLRHAKEAVLSARELTQRLITSADGAVPARQAADLTLLLPDACALALQGCDLRPEYDFGRDLWAVNVDALQISQVFASLVMNAREASPRRICIEARNVVVSPTQDAPGGEYVRIRISDDGVGIPEEVLSKVFDPYFSTKQRGSRKGMGLGLTICRSAILKHSGSVEIESKPGHGTTVTCLLPAAPAGGYVGTAFASR